MKKVEKISEGTHYSAVTVGHLADLNEHRFIIAPGVEVPGKVFVGEALKATGAEVSFQIMPVGQGVNFLHTHKKNEELYIVAKGSGEYQVDGTIFHVEEGSVIRVSPNGKRTWRNTGNEPMVMICVQCTNGSLHEKSLEDGHIEKEAIVW